MERMSRCWAFESAEPSGGTVVGSTTALQVDGWAVSAVVVAFVLGQIVAGVAGRVLGLELWAFVLLSTVASVAAPLWVFRRRWGPGAVLRLFTGGGLSWRWTLLALGAGLAWPFVIDLPISALFSVDSSASLQPGVEELIAGMPWLSSVALGVVGVPLAEELFFRGVLFSWLRSRWNWPLAATASAVPFALLHIEGPHAALLVFVVFLTGVAAAWLFERTGSFVAPVLFHAGNNTVAAAGFYLAGVQGASN
jgi:membrane protease YdiL (CAAX protease family)